MRRNSSEQQVRPPRPRPRQPPPAPLSQRSLTTPLPQPSSSSSNNNIAGRRPASSVYSQPSPLQTDFRLADAPVNVNVRYRPGPDDVSPPSSPELLSPGHEYVLTVFAAGGPWKKLTGMQKLRYYAGRTTTSRRSTKKTRSPPPPDLARTSETCRRTTSSPRSSEPSVAKAAIIRTVIIIAGPPGDRTSP